MKTKTPTAGIVVYSYKDRGGQSSYTPDAKYKLDSSSISDTGVETFYITKSIISISTKKQKSAPCGSFEINLAPTKNWIAAISTGSWLEIHMSPKIMDQTDLQKSSSKTLKMIGCVDSVRVNVSVDQQTGARRTIYTVIGRDWGSVFESYLYIDATSQSYSDSALQAALKPIFGNFLEGYGAALTGIYSTTTMVKELISAWGATMAVLPSTTAGANRLNGKAVYVMPQEMANKLDSSFPKSTAISSLLKIKTGYLSGYDQYTDTKESVGILNTQALIGTNMVWQLLSAHMNSILNELVADLTWNGDKPSITLYKRIKPFALKNIDGFGYSSKFFDLKRHDISKEDIINVNIGDNVEDVVNFIEIMPDISMYSIPENVSLGYIADAKSRSHRVDVDLIARHGIKPLLFSTSFTPTSDSTGKSWTGITGWLDIVQHWYFNSHKMLNGAITLLGQDEYISVGNNIAIDSSVLGYTSYVKDDPLLFGKESKLLAHVEGIQHVFQVDGEGKRSFKTSIAFTRGVITTPDCSSLVNSIMGSSSSFGVETKLKDVTEQQQIIKNTYVE